MSAAVADAIRKHRTNQATLTVLRHDGAPLANQDVVVAQTRHKFLFGATGFHALTLTDDRVTGHRRAAAEAAVAKIGALCNAVTLPFYWGMFEPVQGQPHTAPLRQAAQWWVERGCVVKGHPLCWHSVCADWLLPMSTDEIIKTQIARIKREVADFKGLIDMWDVINEVVIMPIFDKYDNGVTRMCKALGRIETVRTMFETARAEHPGAVLLINDFDMSAAYPILIEGCLEAGISIDVIGVQSHMHQGYWGVEKTLRILDQFAQFDLPIHFTETNLVSGHLMPPEIVDLNDFKADDWPTTPEGEERQRDEAVLHYTTLFAHPQVEALTWWDFGDGAWLNAPAGLIRKDGSAKPSYDALYNLIKGEWWLKPTTMLTDAEGKIHFTGFLGDYELACAGHTTAFSLSEPGAAAIEVRL